MVHPFLILGALLVKKAAIFTAAEMYGYPRIYRRCLEGIKYLNVPKSQRSNIQSTIKLAIRYPSQAYKIFSNTDTRNFIQDYSNLINSPSTPTFVNKVPEFLRNLFASLDFSFSSSSSSNSNSLSSFFSIKDDKKDVKK